MIDFKDKVAEMISKALDFNKSEIRGYIEVPKDTKNGDYSFPCFKLAKTLKKSPIIIANEIKEKMNTNNEIQKVDVLNGYLNFYINKEILVKEVINNVENIENLNKKVNKNIIVEYSSPNIAKPFHIGHLGTTVIGAALYNIYKYLGYNVTGINHLGDYGTQFGKMIEAYKRWGNEYELDSHPIDDLLNKIGRAHV